MKNPEIDGWGKNNPVIDRDGNKFWLNDKGFYHRGDGPAIEWNYGDKEWYINGKEHREDGPARECSNGDKHWYINGKRHREDGPAIEYADGSSVWWYNDEFIGRSEYGFTQEEFERYLRSLKIKEYW